MSERSEGEVPLLVELGVGSDGSAGQWNEEWDEGAQEEGQNQRKNQSQRVLTLSQEYQWVFSFGDSREEDIRWGGRDWLCSRRWGT